MLKRILLASGLLLLSSAVSLAADLNGRWEGSINVGNGDLNLVFHFKVDGANLTGSVETPHGNVDIEQGKVDGSKLSFKTQMGDEEIVHQGTLSGDTIQLKVTGPWGDSDMTLKHVAESKSANP